jgi:hypothetical protein
MSNFRINPSIEAANRVDEGRRIRVVREHLRVKVLESDGLFLETLPHDQQHGMGARL